MGANLKAVNLQGSDITLAQIQSAITLEGAIMPDGTPYETWRKQPLPVTLPEREVSVHPFLNRWGESPTSEEPNTQMMRSPILWAGAGAVTVIVGQLLWHLTRER